MIKNYLKIAFRQFRKQKMFAAIKIGGFAIGISACLLIALFIQNELSYDRSYPDAGRIYRIVGEFNDNGTIIKTVEFPAPMAKVLKKDLPEIEQSGRLMPNPLYTGAGSNELRPEDKNENNHEEGFTYADQEILDILKIPMIYGERAHALTEPNTMVISKTKAAIYFPGQNPVGKIMILNNDKSRPYKITGVMQDFPVTSHLQYDFLLALTGIEFFRGEQSNWNASNYAHYVLLRPGTNIKQFEKKLSSDILQNYFLPSQLKSGDVNAAKVIKSASLYLQPLKIYISNQMAYTIIYPMAISVMFGYSELSHVLYLFLPALILLTFPQQSRLTGQRKWD